MASCMLRCARFVIDHAISSGPSLRCVFKHFLGVFRICLWLDARSRPSAAVQCRRGAPVETAFADGFVRCTGAGVTASPMSSVSARRAERADLQHRLLGSRSCSRLHSAVPRPCSAFRGVTLVSPHGRRYHGRDIKDCGRRWIRRRSLRSRWRGGGTLLNQERNQSGVPHCRTMRTVSCGRGRIVPVTLLIRCSRSLAFGQGSDLSMPISASRLHLRHRC